VTREEVDAALRGSLPNSWRIPGTETSVRLYGFGKANLYSSLNMRDRGDAPSVQGIPLAGSPADLQGGDIGFTARRSRIGFDTQTPSDWGPVFTRVEFDFAGDQPSASGAATSSGYMPRMRRRLWRGGGRCSASRRPRRQRVERRPDRDADPTPPSSRIPCGRAGAHDRRLAEGLDRAAFDRGAYTD